MPPEAAVRVYARASDRQDWPQWEQLRGQALTSEALRELFGPPTAQTDLLLQASGRYLWLALELAAGGARRPRVDGLSLWMEGDHMVDYLPAIYQGQDFTYRYLSIFNTLLMGMEADIEALPRQLDPGSASDGMVDFLARVAVHGTRKKGGGGTCGPGCPGSWTNTRRCTPWRGSGVLPGG